MKFRSAAVLFSFFFLLACRSAQYKDAQVDFYSGNYKSAADRLRGHYQKSSSKDRLLYLMEAGLMLHTDGNYKKSNEVFLEADRIAEELKTSISRETLAFMVNDTKSQFTGESFERVLIKFYLGLNYLLLREFENARVQFRRLEYEQQEMRLNEEAESQNLIARYLTGIVSEYAESYNDARVHYNNILRIDGSRKSVLGDLYILASKEKDSGDMAKYSGGKRYIKSFSRIGTPVPYNSDLGEVVIIYQSGKGAEKESRGKLSGSDEFSAALTGAVRSAIVSRGAALTVGTVLAGLSQAENPIPRYTDKNPEARKPARIKVNGKIVTETELLTDYSSMAISRFDKNYPTIVARNVGNIAVKLVAAAITAKAAEEATKATVRAMNRNAGIVGSIAGAAVGAGAGLAAGYGLGQMLEPDLRTWSTLPANYQAARIFLEPGRYEIEIEANEMDFSGANQKITINLEKAGLEIVNIRSLPRKKS